MAEASIIFLLERLAPYIEKKVSDELGLCRFGSVEVKELSDKLKEIQEVLYDAEQRRVMDPLIHGWLGRVQDISYEFADVLDEWDMKNRRSGQGDTRTWLNKVSSFFISLCLCPKHYLDHRSIALNVKKLNGRLLRLDAEEKEKFMLVQNLNPKSRNVVERVVSTSFVDVSEVQGRDEDREILMNMLSAQPPQKGGTSGVEDAIKIVSIVASGGMGKTTLAQLLYNDHGAFEFDVRIWVCVSDPFDVIKITKAIIEAITKSSPNVFELQSLLESLRGSISGKRFFLVLDDVWIEDDTMWNPLKACLIKNCGLGSRILVTTRNKKVAEVMGSTQDQIHSLRPLSDSYCWSILSKIAFQDKSEIDCEVLKDVGREIALKCKGFPLAAKTLGSMLRFKTSLQEWENVLNCEMLELKEVTKDMFPILAFSYNELPPQVKRCFSYCAVFPKDFLFNVEELVRLWIAQGFIGSPSSGGESIEQRGMQYFENLAMRSFFQDFKMHDHPSSGVFKCKMHDIIHEFAQFLAGNECLVNEEGLERLLDKNVRHTTLLGNGGNGINVSDLSPYYHQLQNLHSFFCKGNEIDPRILIYLKRVRSLNLSECRLKDIPKEIGHLIHLRYLNLGYNDFRELPKTIYDLYNLQTLNLEGCCDLDKLPPGINKLRNLRHLMIMNVPALFPQGFETLTNLQTLNEVICGGKGNNNLGCLKDMNQLRDYLRIWIQDYLDYDDDAMLLEAEKAELKCKKSIQSLELFFDMNVGLRVVEALQPSPNLYTLYFEGGEHLPNWMGSITNLRRLEIFRVMTRELDLSYLKNLHFLEYLSLNQMGMKRLKSFGMTATTFPKLKILKFDLCRDWEEWEEDERMEEEEEEISSILPCLQEFELRHCSKLKALPPRLMRRLSSVNKVVFS